jgi:hypothetical protein
MPVIQCPSCSHQKDVPQENILGKKVRCPECQTVFQAKPVSPEGANKPMPSEVRRLGHLLPFFQCLLRVVIGAAVGACIGIPASASLGVLGMLVGALGGSVGAFAGAIIWTRRTNISRKHGWLVSFSVLFFFFGALFLIWFSAWAMTTPHRHFNPYGDL